MNLKKKWNEQNKWEDDFLKGKKGVKVSKMLSFSKIKMGGHFFFVIWGVYFRLYIQIT